MEPVWIIVDSLAMIAQPFFCRAMGLRFTRRVEEHDQALGRRAVEAVVYPTLSNHPFIVVGLILWVSRRVGYLWLVVWVSVDFNLHPNSDLTPTHDGARAGLGIWNAKDLLNVQIASVEAGWEIPE